VSGTPAGRDFPADFLWGSATSAHQVEGGNTNNDWWAWEQDPRSPAPSSGDGIDHLSRYDEDFALLASLGQNAHRMSLEWSRIEPAPGEFSRAGLDHYARVLESMDRHGLAGFVTLHHKTLPLWFAERGGWLAPDALDRFERYASVVASRLGELAPYFCTINEPQIIALFGYATAQMPPGHRDAGEATEVNHILTAAHRRAVAALRTGAGSPSVGVCLQLAPAEPLRPDHPDDIAAAKTVRSLLVDTHLDDLRNGGDVGDWVGLQYYTRVKIDAREPSLIAPPASGAEATQMGWEIDPAGFAEMLTTIATIGLPIFVTENGIATADDEQRRRFMLSHLSELERVMAAGVDVRGYLHWSAFDNFEWNHGYGPTFGLIGIDHADGLRRVVRPSALAFARLARSGRLDALAGDNAAPLPRAPSAAV
jgi:beta-glucosidase